ncbi:hypothetical protein Tco_1483210 [Tanacetum coccineum]
MYLHNNRHTHHQQYFFSKDLSTLAGLRCHKALHWSRLWCLRHWVSGGCKLRKTDYDEKHAHLKIRLEDHRIGDLHGTFHEIGMAVGDRLQRISISGLYAVSAIDMRTCLTVEFVTPAWNLQEIFVFVPVGMIARPQPISSSLIMESIHYVPSSSLAGRVLISYEKASPSNALDASSRENK